MTILFAFLLMLSFAVADDPEPVGAHSTRPKCPSVRVMTPTGPIVVERCNAQREFVVYRTSADGNSVTYVTTPRFEVP